MDSRHFKRESMMSISVSEDSVGMEIGRGIPGGEFSFSYRTLPSVSLSPKTTITLLALGQALANPGHLFV